MSKFTSPHQQPCNSVLHKLQFLRHLVQGQPHNNQVLMSPECLCVYHEIGWICPQRAPFGSPFVGFAIIILPQSTFQDELGKGQKHPPYEKYLRNFERKEMRFSQISNAHRGDPVPPIWDAQKILQYCVVNQVVVRLTSFGTLDWYRNTWYCKWSYCWRVARLPIFV